MKRLTAALAAFIVASIVWQGSPAGANDGVCGPGDLCLSDGTGLTGGQWDDGGWVADYSSGQRWWGTEASINDQASSAWCKYSFFNCFLYEHSYYRGSYLRIPSGVGYLNLGDYGMNNKASSNNF